MCRRYALLVTLFFFANVWLPTQALAESEQILGFYSQIHVNTDASIDVMEQISVYANRDKIIHGLVRRLPTRYTDSYGIKQHTNYQLTKVLVNNKASPYHIKNSSDQMAIYVGDADTILTPGIYVYTFDYHVNDAINFLKDADELYWNVTGNQWDFPIIKAQVDIYLPAAAKIGLYSGYTGAYGSKDKNFQTYSPTPNQISFYTTQTLASGTGLTVGVSWQKGVVHAPTFSQKLKTHYNSADISIFELALLIFVYYMFVWYCYGKDPNKGTIIPLFEPTDNLSPAAMRYIMQMGFDMKVITTAIINMAVKGFLTINDSANMFSLTKKTSDNALLSVEEKNIAACLFTNGDTVELSNTRNNAFRTIITSTNTILKKNYQKPYFATNYIYLIPGILLGLLAVVIAAFSADDVEVAIFILVWLTVLSCICLALLFKAWSNVHKLIKSPSSSLIMSTLGVILFTVPFLIGEIICLYLISTVLPMITVPLIALIGITNYIFFILMKAPTVAGRKIMDNIEGFKLFLSTTERYRLNQLTPPKNTPELFEKYLPYAIALDVENEWGEQFNSEMQLAGLKPSDYPPTWYRGNNWNTMTPGVFAMYLGNNFSNSMVLASMPPVSQSGSGGGGFSGGGRGGGGGGGW